MKKIYFALISFLIFFLSVTYVFSQSAQFDPSFGNAGIVTSDLGRNTDGFISIALQSTGKIIAIGWKDYWFNYDSVILFRFDANGNTDSTFGNNGEVHLPWEMWAPELIVDANDRILIAYSPDDGYENYRVRRFLSDGTIDSTFSNGGVSSGSGSLESAPIIQPDGKIILLASADDYYYYTQTRITRINDNGVQDSTFGNGGVVVFNFSYGYGQNLALQPDGKILITGSDSGRVMVIRLLSDGVADSTFGSGGIALEDNGSGSSLAVQPDGRILISESNWIANTNYPQLIRVDSTGDIDSTFGVNGVVDFASPAGGKQQVLLQPDGKIILTSLFSNGETFDPLIFRFDENGNADSSFGVNGQTIPSFEETKYGVLTSAILADGKILLSGRRYSNGTQKMILARYDQNGILDFSFGDNGNVILSFNEISYDFAQSVAIQPDGKILVCAICNNTLTTLIRYSTTATIDSSFGENGISTLRDFEESSSGKIASLPDGKIIVLTSHNVIRCLQNGVIDSAFAINGFLYIGWTGDFALQPDGKILVTGVDSLSFIQRFNADGTADLSFGNSGRVNLSAGYYEDETKIQLQSDGRIILGRLLHDFNSQFAELMRLNQVGDIDSTFAISESYISNNGSGHFHSMIIQPDDKILISSSSNTSGGHDTIRVVREDMNGSPDSSFNDDGIFTLGAMTYSTDDNVYQTMLLQQDGKIILGGYGWMSGTAPEMKVARLTSGGFIDSTFDDDGILDFNLWSNHSALALQADGKIIVLGTLNIYDYYFYDADILLARLFPDAIAASVSQISNANLFQLFPDPASDRITLHYSGNYKGAGAVEIRNASGKVVLRKTANLSNGRYTYVDVAQLSNGLYEMILRTDDEFMVNKFIKM